jgi:pimeloyl-ACP methyl ester carboxylesterase
MYRVRKWLLLPGILFLGSLLLLLRSLLKTPQPLVSLLPGDDHLYKWTRGQIFYKVYGNIAAPPLLLLHAPGIGASSYEMLPIMERLAPHYRLYAPDLLGSGLSDAPDIDYNADVFVTLCRDFLRDVVQQPATLFARGLSCQYALAVAAGSPELCSQLVLLSPSNGPINRAPIPLHIWLRGMISQSPLFGTFLYALLTPRIILHQIMQFQSTHKPVSNDDLNYAFAVAHQLGAQYAALAFVTRKLNLDVTLENPLQPTLLLWDAQPLINSVTLHYTSLPQVQEILLNATRSHTYESESQMVASAILQWQTTRHKEIPVAIGTKTTIQESAAPAPPSTTPPEAESSLTEAVENSQPADRKLDSVSSTSPSPRTVEAFCMKCKQKRTMRDPHKIVTKNGRNAIEGRCPVCEIKLFRFVAN